MKRCSALLLVFAFSAMAEDNIGWHVVQKGETLESITRKYPGKPGAWRENWKLNPELKNPNALRPGQRIRVILSRTLPARSAEVSKVARKVERKPEPNPWTPASTGDELKERHGIRTFEKSSAELRFDDRTTLTLTEDSLVFLREAKALPEKRDRSTIEIVDGQADLEKPARTARGHDIEIVVGQASAKPSAGPGQARLRNDGGAARLMAYRGGAALSSGGATVPVPQGMGSSAPPGGGAPSKPEKLLPAPVLNPNERMRTRPNFTWQPVERAATYIVEVCRDERCTQLIDRASDLTATRWQPARPLPLGEAFWRVTARGATALDGYPSDPQKTMIGFGIAGVVREERYADSREADPVSRRTWLSTPIADAAVTLYRDGGDAKPSGDDDSVRATSSGIDGLYEFGALAPGDYWIAIDSRTLGAGWAEQTAGPRGALCEDGRGETRPLERAGPCFAGRLARVSDDASALLSSEHLSLVMVRDADVEAVDFGFSFDVVTHTRDDDDDPSSFRSVQGSLRQFLLNANVRPGPNAMHFVPMMLHEATGIRSERWWVIKVASPLPQLADPGTTVDGSAFTRFGASERGNPGYSDAGPAAGELVDAQRVGASGIALQSPQDVELELDFTEVATTEGLRAIGYASIRHLAMRGAEVNLRVEGTLAASDLIIGLRPDRTAPQGRAGGTGIFVAGDGAATMRRILVGEMSSNGVLVASSASKARIDAEHLEIRRCGFGNPAGDGLAIHSDGSRVAFSFFHQNTNDGSARIDGGSGIEIRADGGADGASAHRNVVHQSTVRGNRKGITISTNALDNRIANVVFDANQIAGVVINSDTSAMVPRRNSISQSAFLGPARAIDIDHRFARSSEGDGPDAPVASVAACESVPAIPQENVRPPAITEVKKASAGFREVAGSVCPGHIVEVYVEDRGAWRYEQQINAETRTFSLPVVGGRVAMLSISSSGSSSELAVYEESKR